MRGVKRCFLFGQDRLARNRHSKDEITIVNGEYKSEHPTELLTVEDLSAIYAMIDVDDKEVAGDSLECVQCAENYHTDDKDTATAHVRRR